PAAPAGAGGGTRLPGGDVRPRFCLLLRAATTDFRAVGAGAAGGGAGLRRAGPFGLAAAPARAAAVAFMAVSAIQVSAEGSVRGSRLECGEHRRFGYCFFLRVPEGPGPATTKRIKRKENRKAAMLAALQITTTSAATTPVG